MSKSNKNKSNKSGGNLAVATPPKASRIPAPEPVSDELIQRAVGTGLDEGKLREWVAAHPQATAAEFKAYAVKLGEVSAAAPAAGEGGQPAAKRTRQPSGPVSGTNTWRDGMSASKVRQWEADTPGVVAAIRASGCQIDPGLDDKALGEMAMAAWKGIVASGRRCTTKQIIELVPSWVA